MSLYTRGVGFFSKKKDDEENNIKDASDLLDENRDATKSKRLMEQKEERDNESVKSTTTISSKKIGEDLRFETTVPTTFTVPIWNIRALDQTSIIVPLFKGINAKYVKVSVPESTQSVVVSYEEKGFHKTWFDENIIFDEGRLSNAKVWQDALLKQNTMYKECFMKIDLDYEISLKEDTIIKTKNGGYTLIIIFNEV